MEPRWTALLLFGLVCWVEARNAIVPHVLTEALNNRSTIKVKRCIHGHHHTNDNDNGGRHVENHLENLLHVEDLHIMIGLASWLGKPCRRRDPNLNECLKNIFQNMFPHLAKGIPEVGIPKFEPLFIEKIGISKGHGAVTLAGTFNNLLAYGPSNTTTTYTRFDIKNGQFDIGLKIPIIRTESRYDLKGNILLLPIVGVGEAKLVLRNVSTEVFMKIKFPRLPGDVEVMYVTDMKVDFRMSSCRVHLDNLFNGNKVLGHTVNTFLNKNALEVVEELKENIGESLSVVFKKIMNDSFGRIPTKYWIPED